APVRPFVPAVEPDRVGRRAERRLERRLVEVAVRHRDHRADRALAIAHVAARTPDEVVRHRLHGHGRVTVRGAVLRLLARRYRLHHADRPAARGSPRQLRSAQDCRSGGNIRFRRCRRELRLPPDAACVEERAGIAAAEAEDVTALDEERTLLLEERLIHAEVDHGGIDLDLAEVRVDRRIERHIARHAVAGVESARNGVLGVRPEGVRARIDVLAARHDVGKQLEAVARRYALHADQVAIGGDVLALRLGYEGGDRVLASTADDTLELDAPELSLRTVEAQLAEGD